jgi:hypothetical protein
MRLSLSILFPANKQIYPAFDPIIKSNNHAKAKGIHSPD